MTGTSFRFTVQRTSGKVATPSTWYSSRSYVRQRAHPGCGDGVSSPPDTDECERKPVIAQGDRRGFSISRMDFNADALRMQ